MRCSTQLWQMWDSCVTFFGNCVSQVSLLSSLLIPKTREPEVQTSPWKTCRCLHISAGLGLNTHPLSLTSLHSFGASSKAYGRLGTRQQGELLMQCSWPGTASAALCAWVWIPLPCLARFHHGSPNYSNYSSQLIANYNSQLQQSYPSLTPALLTSCCLRVPGVEFWKCYSPIALSCFQGWGSWIVLARNGFLFNCPHLGKPVCPRMKILSMRKILKFGRSIREPAGWHGAQKWFHEGQGLPLSRSTLHLPFSGTDLESIWENPKQKLPSLSLLASAACGQILPQWDREKPMLNLQTWTTASATMAAAELTLTLAPWWQQKHWCVS